MAGHDEEAALAVTIAAIRPIDPDTYARHRLHCDERAWLESNCYIDVWLEVLHALGLEPLACAAFTLGIDFEGDQWTFFKPPLTELRYLYGLEVQELTVYRPLIEHVVEQLGQKKLVLTEIDSFFLPDTAATDYRRNHVKTTIAIQEIDVDARRLGYFHNTGYHVLDGEDFADVFALGRPHDPTVLPLFAEFVRLGRARALPTPQLVERSLILLRGHLEYLPANNPVERFAARFGEDVERLRDEGLEPYHLYAFATLRQLGAGFELAASYLEWLGESGVDGLGVAARHCGTISSTAKSLILKGARAVNGRRPLEVAPMMQTLSSAWEGVMSELAPRYGGHSVRG